MIRTKLLPALFLVAGTSGAGAAPSIQADIPYATSAAGEPLRLDLYLPESGAGAALIVWVHGGAWEAGNKSAMPLEPLIERGFAVASVDFSPASKAPFPGQDEREFWQRVEERNSSTAKIVDELGLPEYFAMEAYVVQQNGKRIVNPPMPTSALGTGVGAV